MTEDIFSYILLAGIVGGGIWGISVKVREFSNFVKKNGWHPVRNKIRQFFINVLRITIYIVIGLGYLSSFVFIPLQFEGILENEEYTNAFILGYLFLGLLVFYYVNGIKRRGTKSPTTILSQDFVSFKNGVREFIQEFGTLVKALFVLGGWLLAILAGIAVIALGVWLIVALGPLWIIAIVLILILLVLDRYPKS